MSTTTLSPRQPSAADVVQLLQTAFPNAWERHLRNFLGVTAPADLPPAELARFTDHVFWLVKQTGIKDPAAWLAFQRAEREATMAPVAPVQLEAPVEIAGDIPVQRGSVEHEPVKLGVDLAKTFAASPPTSAAATVTIRTTKAELLSRAKAAIEAGERSLRNAAEALALAQKDFNATQREMAEAVGRSASWVNRLLKWRRTGYKDYSPFGPTTKAGRVAHAQQRTKASRPRKPKATTTTTSADAETSSSSADAETSTSRKPSPAEAKGNLMYAISHWWPYMDHAGKVEVTAFFFKQKGVPVSGKRPKPPVQRRLIQPLGSSPQEMVEGMKVFDDHTSVVDGIGDAADVAFERVVHADPAGARVAELRGNRVW